ncbi:biosynthetic-type acetolactate synthase large subunit [Chitinispirillales bacterium ANBcel5]|uniref:biosynthetic-type acetolactate synthase large subunit n=1 Tax=Cellulosispirillum alkaliphilum TaxID=3039283 RepID=UPI002A5403C0|nr:biosynthetic-type acetolactate synthase large subunit [Chitinispirillales bacterium ANBcel5]
MNKTGAQIVIDAMLKEDVEVVFGYPGGVVIPIFDVLYDTKEINFILTRHEQAAAHAADGFARATGKTGVCIATSGPGATNIMTGLATAYLDSIPMVAITGQVASPLLGTDAFQEADIVGISRPITKHNFLVKSVDELPKVLKQAFHIANTGRPGPVLVDIPLDVSRGVMENYSYPEEVSLRSYKPNLNGHAKQIEKAAEMISQSKKPVIFAGGGIIHSGADKELKELAEKTNIPVTTTFMGLGGFPGDHPLFIGMPGMHGAKCANFTLQECDLIISVGARFDDRVTGYVQSFAPNASIIHMDIDPAAISKIIKVDVPVVGDAKNILTALNKIIKKRKADSWNDQVNEWKGEKLFSYTDSDSEIKPQAVIEKLYDITKGEALVATEVGQHQMWAAQYFRYLKPRTLISSGGLGTMGFGMPAAMGAAFGNRSLPVVDIAGDGSIQMNIQELATLAINNIPVKVIILNNSYLGMVRQWQQLFFNRRYSSTCLRGGSLCPVCNGPENCTKKYIPDFVKLAESYNVAAFRCDEPAEVENVLRKGLEVDGPAVMEFIVSQEENVYPMVPAGKPLDDILEG